MDLATRVRRRREELNMTQAELARRMGYKSRVSVNKIEMGRPVSQKIIVRLSEALGVSVPYLMGWDEPIASADMQVKNGGAVDVLMRMGSDQEFADTVKLLYKIDGDQLRNVKNLLAGFIK